MNIGIFVPIMGNFGNKDYYNSQELGLAKELSKNSCNVTIFKLVINKNEITTNIVDEKCRVKYIPAKKIGINGIILNFDFIDDEKIEKLICFSDTQIIVSKLYNYCIRKKIDFIPYIGTIKSHSKSLIIRNLMKLFQKKNIKIYKKCNKIMAKTPKVIDFLEQKEINNSLLSPVGLDFDLMNKNFKEKRITELKKELGYREEDNIILFIGRLEEEKKPLEAIKIMKNILLENGSFKMIMIGSGQLKDHILTEINNDLKENIKIIEKVKNDDIWKYYRISNCFINLNENEIFGMAILEAMYYECPVIAVKAPGPEYIISDSNVGIIVEKLDKKEICQIIIDKNKKLDSIRENSNQYIKEYFSWKICAENVLSK